MDRVQERFWFLVVRFFCLQLIICGESVLTPVSSIHLPFSRDYSHRREEKALTSAVHTAGDSGAMINSLNRLEQRTTSISNETAPVKRQIYDFEEGYQTSGYRLPHGGDYVNWQQSPPHRYQQVPTEYPLALRPPIRQDLLLKELLVPLAGVALFGVTALLISNPVFFKFGVVAGRRRRRRRQVPSPLESVTDPQTSDVNVP